MFPPTQQYKPVLNQQFSSNSNPSPLQTNLYNPLAVKSNLLPKKIDKYKMSI